jgi:hypothetical protein
LPARLKPEEVLQRSVVEYLDWACLGKPWRYFHVPNGGRMSRRRGGRLKKMGVKPGAPDLMIQRTGGRVVEIELKARRRYQSPHQKEWQQGSIRLGIPYYLVRSLSDLQEALEKEELI